MSEEWDGFINCSFEKGKGVYGVDCQDWFKGRLWPGKILKYGRGGKRCR